VPNLLTPLIPIIYDTFEMRNREMVGFIPSVTRNQSAERAAVGQTVQWSLPAKKRASFNVTPSMTIPEPTDIAPEVESMTITKSKGYEFGVTGEEQRSVNWAEVQSNEIAEQLRNLTNEMEVDVAVEAALNGSRVCGTAGTTPFGGAVPLQDLADLELILNDNGVPTSGRSLILNNVAASKFKTIQNLTRVNEAGTSMNLRTGELIDLYGLSIKQSGANPRFVKGTATGATTNATGYAEGVTVITLAAAGTGVVKKGDVITFAGDPNRYMVAIGNANVSAGGTITLGAPGLRQAIPAAATAISLTNNYAANVAFQGGAIHLATRAPARPSEGDAALDVQLITDPYSGITYEFAVYGGYRKLRYEVTAAWGVKAWYEQNIALLLG
jgi:P22 coat protein - gene protein 5